jgi:peptide deformylase
LLLYPDKLLREKCQPVTAFGPDLEVFCADLAEVLRRWRGAAIAAPQVGRLERVIIIAGEVVDSVAKPPPLVLVNPEVVSANTNTAVEAEGCLSFLEARVNIARPTSCVVRAQRPGNGEVFEVTANRPYLARALLHEIDHLDGRLLLDYASPLKREMIKKKLKRTAGKLIMPPLPPLGLDAAKVEQLRAEHLKGECLDCRHFTLPDPPLKVPLRPLRRNGPSTGGVGLCTGEGVKPDGSPVGSYVIGKYSCRKLEARAASEESA